MDIAFGTTVKDADAYRRTPPNILRREILKKESDF
jgi:hypothetical protein